MEKSYIVNRNIKRIIEKDGRIQRVVAERSGLRKDTLSRILSCKRPVYSDEIPALAAALNVSIGELFAPIPAQ